ncbi:glycosyltransferase family 2 protein [Microbacterium sp.]|uniref:glycosyltransferase family 2 protein n=1 Tax=Microbacterium sp. TaxID=51671 RepID=UPI002811E509|nr:glycosyltransferase family 2 protein [Microbacterium sp.]
MREDGEGRFVLTGRAEVAAIVVTYGSAADLGRLIQGLRTEAQDVVLRVIVADNSPDDATLGVARAHPDVIAVPTHGNLGYAGGVNVGLQYVGDAESVLILNPDLRVHAGALRTLLGRLRADPDRGVVVPRIVDETGATSFSLFREPAVLRALGDAVLGPLWPGRPAALSECVRDRRAYTREQDVDWATGAAVLFSERAVAAVGEWDERFFLYSEETDILRRVRDAGLAVRYVPDAVVAHSQGGSGSSPALEALLEVNRVRYVRKHAPRRAALYRAAVVVGAAMRAPRSERHRRLLDVLRDDRGWHDLPAATWRGSGSAHAAIVIPAYNEAAVIERTLARLAEPAAAGSIEVVVVCNGCTDDTAARASTFPGVRVVELAEGSKPNAINAGIARTAARPVLVLDADIELSSAAIPGLVRALRAPGAVGGRPPFEYDLARTDPWVRSYYRARSRMPAMSSALWGAGVYALTREGAARVTPLPPVTADDVYVDRRVRPAEKRIPPLAPVRVRVPRTARALLDTLVRVRRGPAQQGVDTGDSTARQLLRTATSAPHAWDAAVYAAFALLARRRATSAQARWERDGSTRIATA